MPDAFDWLLWLIVIVPVAFYLIVPLAIKPTQRYPAHPGLRDLDTSKLRPSLAHFLKTQANELFKLGFGEPTLVQIPNSAPNVSAYLIMMVNRHTGDKAMVTALVAHGPVTLQCRYLEFSTRFESGELFDTHNSTELGAFPPGPKTVKTQVPSVVDTEELFELHTFVMNKHDVRSRKTMYEPGQALDYLVQHALIESYEQQVDRGWFYYDEAGDLYRPTLKGIYLIVWGQLQPFKACRYLALRKRERAILEEFDQSGQAGRILKQVYPSGHNQGSTDITNLPEWYRTN